MEKNLDLMHEIGDEKLEVTDETMANLVSLIMHGQESQLEEIDTIMLKAVDAERGCNALHILCSYPDLKINHLNFFLKYKFNFNEEDNNAVTPLHYACTNNAISEEALLFLKSQNVDLEHVDHFGYTPLHVACVYGNLNAIQFLIDNKVECSPINQAGGTPLHCACSSTNISLEMLKLLAAQPSIKFDATDTTGIRPLHLACANNNVTTEILKFLTEQPGVDLGAKDQNGDTALHYACDAGNFNAINFLIERGGIIYKEVFSECMQILEESCVSHAQSIVQETKKHYQDSFEKLK